MDIFTTESYDLIATINHIKKNAIVNRVLIIPRTRLIPNECQIYKQILNDILKDKIIEENHSIYNCSYWIRNNLN